jgi:glutamate N-acetyltransferase/amino-acid N-acetyltransferase
MEKIARGIREAAASIREGEAASLIPELAAQAIMTTDTKPKLAIRSCGCASVLGLAKGAAMIHPNMATMLAAIVTDARVDPSSLLMMLHRAVGRSFNAITVDGDQSTNDTVLVLANGLAGPVAAKEFESALIEVCRDLAQQIVRDAEGATKFVKVRVTGASSEVDARALAKTIANSVLVKTAIYGGDPNWGRVLMAAGNSGVLLEPERVALWFTAGDGSPLQVVAGGTPLPYDEGEAAAIFAATDLAIHLDLGLGASEAVVWTSDLSHDYVTLNAHYRT